MLGGCGLFAKRARVVVRRAGLAPPHRADVWLPCIEDHGVVCDQQRLPPDRLHRQEARQGRRIHQGPAPGAFEVIVNQHTANADRVDFIIPGPQWPYALARRMAPRLQQVTGNRAGEVSKQMFEELFDLYGVDLRHGIAVNQWRNIVRVQFT